MKKMFLDIETVPAGEEHFELLKKLHVKSEQKKAARNARSQTFDDFHKGTGFSGAFGRIVCIAYALDNGKIESLSGNEKEMLTKFWEIAKDVDLFVGHNILDFDLRFIIQRSIVLGVKPSRLDLSFARYKNFPIFDTMEEWSKWGRNSESQDTLAHAFGLPSSKEEMDGSEVWEYFKKGKIKEICEYCKRDVEVNREVYKRMVFEEEQELKIAGVEAKKTEDEPF
jgi:predicted PolB exonuclease-like 3'-5' exonuclease